jgi:hypothetical protein
MPQPPRNRKDHYVPQGYLKGFIDPARVANDRPLWCLNKPRNIWERKSTKQICHAVGMYDFSNDAIDAEHADVTFKSMEDGFPTIRDQLREVNFGSWRHDLPFLRSYMEMIRIRSPLYFEEQGQAIADSFLGRVVTVDEGGRKIVYDNSHPLTEDEVHDHTLVTMREEFRKGSPWMEDFHWQIRTTFDSRNPVITSESPLFVKINRPGFHGPITDEALRDPATEVYFPLCWEACLVGRLAPFEADVRPFAQTDLDELRHMMAEMAPEFVVAPQVLHGLLLDGRPAPRVATRK